MLARSSSRNAQTISPARLSELKPLIDEHLPADRSSSVRWRGSEESAVSSSGDSTARAGRPPGQDGKRPARALNASGKPGASRVRRLNRPLPN